MKKVAFGFIELLGFIEFIGFVGLLGFVGFVGLLGFVGFIGLLGFVGFDHLRLACLPQAGASRLTFFESVELLSLMESRRSRIRWTFFSTRSSHFGQEEKGMHFLKFSTWNQSSTSKVKRML